MKKEEKDVPEWVREASDEERQQAQAHSDAEEYE